MMTKCWFCLWAVLSLMNGLQVQDEPLEACPPLVSQAEVLDCWLDKIQGLFEKGQVDSALLISNRLKPFTKKEQEARRLYLNSLIYLNLSKYDSSFEAGKSAAKEYKALKKVASACKAYNTMGSALRELGTDVQ